MNTNPSRTYEVFKNDKFTGQIISGRFSNNYLKQIGHDLVAPHAHMAELHKTEFGYEYATTIGVYIQFREVK